MSQLIKVKTNIREVNIPLEISNFGSPYKILFDKAVASGAECWLAYSHNNFNNEFQKADEQRYKDKGWFAEIFKDKVAPRTANSGETTYGRLPLRYIANAGTEFEKEIKVLAPKSGWYVPTDDDTFIKENGIWIPFHEGTLIPFETVPDKKEAMKRLEKRGIPKEQVSFFYRLDNYDSERFVGRDFNPDIDGHGRFDIDANRRPDDSGNGRLGSRSADEPKIVGEVEAPKKEAVV